MSEEKASGSVVGIMDNLTMPAMWDSRGDGLSLDYGDFICVLQTEPRGLVEVGLEMGKFPKEMGTAVVKHMKDFGMKYHYAMFCYWKKGRNPDGYDSSRPAIVYTIETSKAAPTPMLCAFTPTGHKNYGELSGEATPQNMLFALLKILTNGDVKAPKKLGGIGAGYKIMTGKEWHPAKKGCLIPLVLAVGSVVAACVAICCMVIG